MIPLFPNFKQLELEDENEIHTLIINFLPYSDLNIVNLWSYNTENDILLSRLGNNIIVRLRDYITNEPFYTFIGHDNAIETTEALLDLSQKENTLPFLKLIPEETITKNKELYDFFNVQEDRSNFDYIIPLNDLSALSGAKYATKRHLLNNFITNHQYIRLDILNIQDSDIQNKIIEVFFLWEKRKNLKRLDTIHELTAIQRMLKQSHNFNLLAIGAYIDNKLTGFIIDEIVHNNYAIGYFFKVDPSHKGIHEYIQKKSAEELIAKGCKFKNFQQDLNIKGLRNSKQLWHPSHFLKKYTISKK